MLHGETAASPAREAAALAGLAAYQNAPRAPPPPAPPVIANVGRARLLDYGGSGPPLVMVPSLINPPSVLDLTEDCSLLRWLARHGIRPLLVDWGAPGAEERDLDVAGHVGKLLLPLIDAVGERPLLAGYCLGGTMALAAAAVVRPLGLALIATPWRFAGFPVGTREQIAAMWAAARPAAERLGYLPLEVLQAGFWRIDPGRTIDKFVRFGRLDPASEAARRFVALEDWANDGAPLTFAAAAELFDRLVAGDASGRRRWRVAGERIVPGRIVCPVLNIVSASDRIVPAATAIRSARRVTLREGHVGMIVGGRAPERLWRTLSDWLSEVVAPR